MKDKKQIKKNKDGKIVTRTSHCSPENNYGAFLDPKDYATMLDYLYARGI